MAYHNWFAAAAAKSLQSCPTLCDLIDGSLPGSPARDSPEMDSEIKEEIPVHEEFILCCGVETQVLKCGPWTDLINNQSGTRPKLLIFIIPGNPGFSAMYVPFAKALYSATKRRFPVWIISHAGHALAPRGKKILKSSEDPNAEEIKDIYGVRGQVEHKLAFLRTQVPKEMKLVVIGHSIGSYFSLEILKHAPELPQSFKRSGSCCHNQKLMYLISSSS
ncbi:lipid droplet-associated hydrolase isoform X4 [Bos javanicus]|uniref:lipid droplet-associated hydrolase isoform X4 n=1 Tax=Bos javanicus TaxID=9906 RepID=UPI002AA808CD|nr:lipid droplet-associated hydrolase isoform X4 [Bos javanicus]